MNNLQTLDKDLLSQIANIHSTPQGTYNIRKNGQSIDSNSDTDIQIVPKKNKEGIDVYVRAGTKNKSVHIPVIITESGINDLVFNDFYIGDGSEVTIVAGCGIHNTGKVKSEHNGIHSFHIGKNSKIKYIEKHLGLGNKSEKVLNPVTNIEMANDSELEMETVQLGGVTYSKRTTNAKLESNAKLIIKERLLTTEKHIAITNFDVELIGKNSSVDVISRSVAKDSSYQEFNSNIIGKTECFGHVECDGIITDKARIASTPRILAEDVNASLVHEAAIGKIASDQVNKLLTLGLSKEEAENVIIKGFLNG